MHSLDFNKASKKGSFDCKEKDCGLAGPEMGVEENGRMPGWRLVCRRLCETAAGACSALKKIFMKNWFEAGKSSH
jgi:hypothetical protein